MTLSTLAILLGLVFIAATIFALMEPEKFTAIAQVLPRNIHVGYALMGVATAWFVYNVGQENIADFENFKKPMMIGFASVGVLTCIYVSDFLPARGLGILLMMLAKFMLDTARWYDTGWRLVIAVLAYAWVIAGMWFTISPYRLRDLLDWAIASRQRLRVIATTKLVFGAGVLLLGLTVYRLP